VTFLANSKYAARLPTTRASAVIADESVVSAPCAVLRTPQPYLAWAEAVSILAPVSRPAAGISPLASVDATASLGAQVHVGPFAVIGPGARIGDRAVSGPHVVIGDEVIGGPDSIVRAHVSLREGAELGAGRMLHAGG